MTAPLGGRSAALALLAEIERLNWEEDDDQATHAAVRAALKASAGLPDRDFDAFAEVIADLLRNVVLGFSIDFHAYTSALADQ